LACQWVHQPLYRSLNTVLTSSGDRYVTDVDMALVAAVLSLAPSSWQLAQWRGLLEAWKEGGFRVAL
jgi:hypothetical protein